MKRIFKYPLDPQDQQTLHIHQPAKILSVSIQEVIDGDVTGESVVLYALVDDSLPTIPVDVRVVGTGHLINFDTNQYQFVGTVNLYKGRMMFHIFVKLRQNSDVV